MATDHSLSMITNSSVKPPVNPQNGMPNTYHERMSTPGYWEITRNDSDDDQMAGGDYVVTQSKKAHSPTERRKSAEVTLSPRDPMIEKLAEDMNTMSDVEFYKRLQALKSDHQKTLQLYEDAYYDKLSESSPVRDQVKDMSRPAGSPRVLTRNAWQTEAEISKTDLRQSFNMSDASEEEESDEEFMVEHPRKSSLKYRRQSPDHMNSSIERINEMWRDFKVEDYAERLAKSRERPASATDTASLNKENQDTWSPIITIPKPFQMTLRDANKPKKLTKAQEEHERQQLEKQKTEEAECTKKFKASPAPAHIYLPMYDEIVEQQETKRRLNHNYREELLRSVEKPFKFYQREEAKNRQKRAQALVEAKNSPNKTKFKAKPVPAVLEEDVMDKLAEEEEYRKIRVRMRAEELLKESKLPPSMDAREKHKQLSNKLKQIAKTAKELGLRTEPTFKPKITEEIPDFEEQHRKMQWQLASRKAEREATVTKPFNLRTSRILSNKDKIYDDIRRDEEELPENRWPFKTGRTKPSNIGKMSPSVTSSDSVPFMSTQAAELRVSHTKSKITDAMQRDVSKMEAERKRRQKEKRLKKQVVEKAAANDITYGLQDTTKDKLKRFREEERARQEEYRRSMREMQERIEDRPLLFEKATQKIARERAERRYNETLAKAGISKDSLPSDRSMSPRYDFSVDIGSDDGSYRPPSHSPRNRSPRSPAVNSQSSRDVSYSNTFTKEDTGLSDGDYSDRDSIPDETLEMMA